MRRKKHSMVKAILFTSLIITLNFVGISYGYWQDDLTNKVRIQAGYIQPNFETEPAIRKSSGLRMLEAELVGDSDSKTIEVTGEIENCKDGKFQLNYTVINNGSLPIEFDDEAFEDWAQQIEGLTVVEKPTCSVIDPNENWSDSITMQIEAPELTIAPPDAIEADDLQIETEVDELQADTPESEGSVPVGDYSFEIVLPYRLYVD